MVMIDEKNKNFCTASRASPGAELSDAPGAGRRGKGGTGELFDHRKIKGFEKPFFLSGGLTPENARGAAENVRPYGIDLSSGLETNGKKDEKKIEELIRRIRK